MSSGIEESKKKRVTPSGARIAADLYGDAYCAAERLYFDGSKRKRTRLVKWANSLTSSNCGWTEYWLGKIVIASHERALWAAKKSG